mmetsp:Transcript_36904/g.95558  ORF Transcript_36904/g.95558 Transcript_36904/m.95558 type:complete len:110 (+) Transcript_36904:1803-2132(+)
MPALPSRPNILPSTSQDLASLSGPSFSTIVSHGFAAMGVAERGPPIPNAPPGGAWGRRGKEGPRSPSGRAVGQVSDDGLPPPEQLTLADFLTSSALVQKKKNRRRHGGK